MARTGQGGGVPFTVEGWATAEDSEAALLTRASLLREAHPASLPDGVPASDAAAMPMAAPAGGDPEGPAEAATGAEAVSNDPNVVGGSLWGMYGDASGPAGVHGSQAAEVWEKGVTGSTKVVVGVIDSGINYAHVDLYLNIWLNQKEIPTAIRDSLTDVDGDGIFTFRDLNGAANGAFVSDVNRNGYIDAGDLLNDTRWENGLDEDGNGLKDDLVGWDYYNNDNDPWDDNGHGTHVAGTIGAVGGNGTGVAGVNWSVQLVALKFSGADGAGFVSRAAYAVDYFTNASKANPNQNFVATNNSWSTTSYSSMLQGAIDRAAKADILTVASAGNQQRDTDVTPNYPAAISTLSSAGYESVISVASINSGGGLSWFSNWGDVTVDIGAPGEGILSTSANGSYTTMSGTSTAAPHVTGALALFASHNMDASAAAIRQALLDSAAPTASLAGRTMSGGRLDLDAMMQRGAPYPSAEPPPPEPPPSDPPPSDPPPPDATDAEPPPDAPPTDMLLVGSSSGDTLTGGEGADTLTGVPDGDRRLGANTIDVLTGGVGNDLFILGDTRGAFYDDNKSTQAGMNNYARIMDFEDGDRIQVAERGLAYLFREKFTRDAFTGTGIFLDTDASGTLTRTDEMVALIVGAGPGAMSQADFVFI